MTAACSALGTIAAVPSAHASILSGDTLDAVANVLAWIVLFIAPAIAIGVFWIVHILPERIAEKRGHPQAGAIKMLCLLSLVFGGLLWPLAWLWAYSKPVLYKMAYGTDVVRHDGHDGGHDDAQPAVEPATTHAAMSSAQHEHAPSQVDQAVAAPPAQPMTDGHSAPVSVQASQRRTEGA